MNVLKALYDYAVASGLANDPFIDRRQVSRLLVLEPRGSFTIEHTGTPQRPKGTLLALPTGAKRSGDAPFLLADTAEYVLGVPPDGDGERAAARHSKFIALMETAATEIRHPEMLNFTQALRKAGFPDLPIVEAAKILPIDVIGCAIRKSGKVVPFTGEDPGVSKWWRKLWNKSGDNSEQGYCSVTGAYGTLQRIHQGYQLLSFLSVYSQASATHVHGLMEGNACPMLVDVSLSIVKALRSILDDRKGRARSIRVGDLWISMWPGTTAADDAARTLYSLIDPTDEEMVINRLDDREIRTWKGYQDTFNSVLDVAEIPLPKGISADATFDIAIFAKHGKRMQIRGCAEHRFGDVWKNVCRYFQEMAVEDPWQKRIRSDFPLREIWIKSGKRFVFIAGVIDMLFKEGKGKKAFISAEFVRSFYFAVLEGRPFSAVVGARILERLERWYVHTRVDKAAQTDIRASQQSTLTFVAILKAFLIRNTPFKDIPPMFDMERCKHRAYLYGAILALTEKIQKRAIYNNAHEVGKSVATTYYAMASRNPAKAFKYIMPDVHHHLRKIRGSMRKPGLAYWFEAQLGKLLSAIPADDAGLPLDAHGQMLFAMGYWQMMTSRKKVAETPPAEAEVKTGIATV